MMGKAYITANLTKGWKLWFQLLKPLTDNVAILTILACVSYVTIISVIRFFILDRKKMGGALDITFLLSVAYMQKNLYLIHKRIFNAIKYTTYIITSSDTYLAAFQKQSGTTATKTSEIAKILYQVRPEKWEEWARLCIPYQLYYRFGRAFHAARGFLGIYIDDRATPLLVFVFIFVMLLFMWFIYANNKEVLSIGGIIIFGTSMITLYLFGSIRIGTMLAFVTLFISELILCSGASAYQNNKSKLHIKAGEQIDKTKLFHE